MMIWAVTLATMELSPHGLTAWPSHGYSEFDREVEISPFTSQPVALPLARFCQTLVLKLFRREPAITKFDQLFTSYPSSSEGFAQPTGSDLLSILLDIHPGQGKLTWLRVLNKPSLFALLTLGFPLPPSRRTQTNDLYKLVGSFFNRHTVTRTHLILNSKCKIQK